MSPTINRICDELAAIEVPITISALDLMLNFTDTTVELSTVIHDDLDEWKSAFGQRILYGNQDHYEIAKVIQLDHPGLQLVHIKDGLDYPFDMVLDSQSQTVGTVSSFSNDLRSILAIRISSLVIDIRKWLDEGEMVRMVAQNSYNSEANTAQVVISITFGDE